jgi:hypothetical protein
LVQELEEGMLRVIAELTPDAASVSLSAGLPSIMTDLPLLSISSAAGSQT